MKTRLSQELTGFFNLLFPPACPLCSKTLQPDAEDPFCSECSSGISTLPDGRCSRCALPFVSRNSSSHLCESCCRVPPPFHSVYSVGVYEGTLRESIHRFKYEDCHYLDRPLGILLSGALQGVEPPNLIVPVPLHVKRLRQRTYNQSLLLARELGRMLCRPVAAHLLTRVRNTPQQQGLSASERSRNMHDAFVCQRNLAKERILLVDDVMTTGATAVACSRVLAAAGASEVRVAVVGRAGLW